MARKRTKFIPHYVLSETLVRHPEGMTAYYAYLYWRDLDDEGFPKDHLVIQAFPLHAGKDTLLTSRVASFIGMPEDARCRCGFPNYPAEWGDPDWSASAVLGNTESQEFMRGFIAGLTNAEHYSVTNDAITA